MLRQIIYSSILFIFLFTSSNYSQWFWQNPLPRGNPLYHVHVFNSNTAIAVGAIGTVIKTTDGGTSWNSQTSGTTVLLESVHFTDNNTGWVVEWDGTILNTTDGGTNWDSKTSGTTELLRSVNFTDNNTGSEIVEAAVDWLEGQINIEAEILELKCTNRYSSGYCEWNVSDQHKLFPFFPDNFCEIEITDSALMTPIKSISGIIGLSENVMKKTDTCNICSMVNFYIRLQEYE